MHMVEDVFVVLLQWLKYNKMWENTVLPPPVFSPNHSPSNLQNMHSRALAGPWKSWNNFSRFSRPGKSLKTDMVLESTWICVWRSLKVLEFDFLKRGQEARESYFFLLPEAFCGLKHAENAIAAGAPPRTLLGELTTLLRPSSLVWVNLVLRIYPSYGPWKSLNLILTNRQEPWQRNVKGNTIGYATNCVATYCIVKYCYAQLISAVFACDSM